MNLAIVYLLAITAAEVITVLVDTFAGIIYLLLCYYPAW
jgi:hypothetical protein